MMLFLLEISLLCYRSLLGAYTVFSICCGDCTRCLSDGCCCMNRLPGNIQRYTTFYSATFACSIAFHSRFTLSFFFFHFYGTVFLLLFVYLIFLRLTLFFVSYIVSMVFFFIFKSEKDINSMFHCFVVALFSF